MGVSSATATNLFGSGIFRGGLSSESVPKSTETNSCKEKLKQADQSLSQKDDSTHGMRLDTSNSPVRSTPSPLSVPKGNLPEGMTNLAAVDASSDNSLPFLQLIPDQSSSLAQSRHQSMTPSTGVVPLGQSPKDTSHSKLR